jgi:hypothetical protein
MKLCWQQDEVIQKALFLIPFYLQSVLVHSANDVKTYTLACRRVLTSALLLLIRSKPFVALGKETYKLN